MAVTVSKLHPVEMVAKTPEIPKNLGSFWQGQKDSNPRHAVLDTADLPAELYPYFALGGYPFGDHKNGGPSGTRTQDRPVMSRLL